MEARGLSRVCQHAEGTLDYNRWHWRAVPRRLYDGRSRTFFFVNYEATRINRGRTVPIRYGGATGRRFSAMGSATG
jgi:hypothetical protein